MFLGHKHKGHMQSGTFYTFPRPVMEDENHTKTIQCGQCINDWLNSFIRSSLTQHMVKYTQIKIIYIKHRNRSMYTQNKDRITRIKQ